MNKKLVGGLVGLVLLTGCAGNKCLPDKNVEYYQAVKQETTITKDYVIQKNETYTYKKIKQPYEFVEVDIK